MYICKYIYTTTIHCKETGIYMYVAMNIKYAHACTCIRASNVLMSKQWLPSPTTNNASETMSSLEQLLSTIAFHAPYWLPGRYVIVSVGGLLLCAYSKIHRHPFTGISEDSTPPTFTISSQSLKYFICPCWIHNSVPIHLYILSHSWYACACLLQRVLPPIWPLNTLQRIASTACSTTFRAFCHQRSITLCWETKKINLFASFRASFGMCMGFASCDIQWTQKGLLGA